ncbi:MAG: tetratricopeptide repeat protein [Nannocystaceae bacterium]
MSRKVRMARHERPRSHSKLGNREDESGASVHYGSVVGPLPSSAPRVLVSYSHDSDEHRARVRALVDRLRGDGVDARVDLDHTSEPEGGWPKWCDDQIDAADYVLVVCTPTYRRRFEAREALGQGRGVTWESRRLLDGLLYDGQDRNYRIVPVLLTEDGADAVPMRVRRTRRYRVRTHYDELLTLLRDEHRRAALRDEATRYVLPTEVEELLSSEREDLPPHPAPSRLLVARFGVVPFSERAREHELRQLEDWCAGDGVRARLFHGPGGSGKTRLFREWCTWRRRESWLAGFVRTKLTANDIDALLKDPRPTLLVVDYAASKPLTAVLDAALACREQRVTPLRIALLDRTEGDWWAALKERSDDLKGLLEHDDPVVVQPLSAKGDLRHELFVSAFERFAEHRELEATAPEPSLDDERFERVLYVHAAALDHVEHLRRGSTESKPAAAQGVLESLLGHEARFWFSRWLTATPESDREALAADEHARRRFIDGTSRAVGAMTLRGGLPHADLAAEVLEAVDAPAHPLDGRLAPHRTVQMLLRDMYPGRQVEGGTPLEREATELSPLEPDLLGEALVARVLERERNAYIDAAFTNASPSAWENGFTVLGRAMERTQTDRTTATVARAAQWLLSQQLEDRAVPAVRAALTVSEKKVFGRLAAMVTARIMEAGPRVIAKDLDSILPDRTLSLVELRAWAIEQLLPEATGANRAGLLNNLGVMHNALGRREDALASTLEAVAIRRTLAELRPDAFLPDLASSLSNLGVVQDALGRREGALAATLEAVNLYRTLAEQRPDAFLPDLAASLNNLGMMQSALGCREDALTSTLEAVTIRRTLAEQRPNAFLPDLARSLNNLGIRHNALGYRDDALAATLEAVAIRRALSEQQPFAFLPDLATSLNNLGADYKALGRQEEAFTSTVEAVAIRRTLAEQQPDAYLPDLASSLINLGNRHSALGRREDALASTLEAVAIYRDYFERIPDAFEQNLRTALNNLRDHLEVLGRDPAADPTHRAGLESLARIRG